MNKSFKLLHLIAAGAAVVGCTDYDLGITADEIRYKDNFVKVFGQIDPNQNFNMAAQYADLCNSRKNAVTRAGEPVAPAGWTTTEGELQIITLAEIADAQTYFPEGTFSPSNYAAANAYYISDGKPLYLRPIYSQTNSTNTIGVYNVENPEEKLLVVSMAEGWQTTGAGRTFGHVYEVNIPKGAKYGFYLSRADGHTHYSEVYLNRQNGDYAEYGTCQDCNITLAQGGAYLGFEDWGHSGGQDYDCNDMIFHVSPTLVDKVVKLDSWIVAFEDLGDVYDIDFNDVVLDVTHSGTTLTITPLAAGGTIPSNVYFKEGTTGEAQAVNGSGNEIHKLLGSDDHTHPINANGDNPTPGASVTLTVSEGYNLTEGLARGDFYIVSDQSSRNLSNSSTSHVITTCTIAGEAPKAIVVPSSWEWPIEECPITTAYPSFTKWVADATYDVWITDKKPGSFVKRITASVQESEPVIPTEDPNYVPGKGVLVSLTNDASNSGYRFINPSYFEKASEKAIITIEENSSHYFEMVIVGPGFTKVVLSQTSSATLTGDNLAAAKIYGVELQQYGTFDWSTANVYVMIDGSNQEEEEQEEEEEEQQDTVDPNLTTTITEGIANNMILPASYFPSSCTKATLSFTHDGSTNRMYIAFAPNNNYSFGFETSAANETITHVLSDTELESAKAGTLKLTSFDNDLLQYASKIVIVTE